MNNNNTLSIKVRIGKHNVEIRRVTIPTPQSFDEFRTSVSSALDLSKRFPGELRFLYEDEESDLVSILTNADLVEALRHVSQLDDKLLRLSIVPVKEREKDAEKRQQQGHGHHGHGFKFGHCRRGEQHPMAGAGPLGAMLQQLKASIPDLLANPALRSMAEGVISSNNLVRIDTGRICDCCNAAIIGDRFASTTQDDFDLCAACMLGPEGPKLEAVHKFKKISAFDALMDCIQKGGAVDAFFAGGEEPKAQNAHHATCDVCSATIVGNRYKSFVLADYDECEKCRNSASPHPASDFFLITDVNVRQIPAEAIAQFKARKEAEAQAQEAEKKAKEAEQLAVKAREEAERVSRLVKPVPVPVKQPEQPKAQEKAEEKAQPEREKSAFESNLATLEAMGFTDRKKSIAALVRNRNSLFATIQELLQ